MSAGSLFAWQRAILASPVAGDLALAGIRIALDSSQTTGRDVVINDTAVAADLGRSVRTVWRRVSGLVAAGWLVQTAAPTYTGAGERGRRARYSLTIPGEASAPDPDPAESTDPAGREGSATPESFATTRGTLAHDQPVDTCHDTRGDGTRLPKSSDNPRGAMAHDNPSRLPNQAQSFATTTPDDGTLSPSDGFSSSSSCSDVPNRPDDLPVEILASKLRQTTALAGLRTDKLRPHQITRITELIAQHGDQRLVTQALAGLRRDNPPLTIQAFLPGWENIPPPGHHLALVKDPPCPQPGHNGTTRHCIACASEAKAGHR